MPEWAFELMSEDSDDSFAGGVYDYTEYARKKRYTRVSLLGDRKCADACFVVSLIR